LDMGVHNGLTGGFAHVHAHVIPVRVQVRIQLRTDLPNQLKRGFALILGEIEEVGEMAKRDDQHVPFADGIPIIAGVAKGIPEDYFLGNWRAEWALGIHKGEGHEPGESVWMNSATTRKSASSSEENARIGNFSRSGLSGIN